MFISPDRHVSLHRNASWLPRDRFADAAFQHYLDWREASAACESAYRRWATTDVARDARLAFAAYTAALDREQQAAAQYETAMCVATKGPPR
jgi:hypothetical protein